MSREFLQYSIILKQAYLFPVKSWMSLSAEGAYKTCFHVITLAFISLREVQHTWWACLLQSPNNSSHQVKGVWKTRAPAAEGTLGERVHSVTWHRQCWKWVSAFRAPLSAMWVCVREIPPDHTLLPQFQEKKKNFSQLPTSASASLNNNIENIKQPHTKTWSTALKTV